jgi:hypothetical protein
MEDTERNQAIQKIQSDVEDIKRDVALIIQHLLVPPFLPGYTPSTPKDIDPYIGVTKCQKCGMEFKGVTGYVCADNNCPMFMKPWSGRGVSKITTTGGSWQSYNERTKE